MFSCQIFRIRPLFKPISDLCELGLASFNPGAALLSFDMGVNCALDGVSLKREPQASLRSAAIGAVFQSQRPAMGFRDLPAQN